MVNLVKRDIGKVLVKVKIRKVDERLLLRLLLGNGVILGRFRCGNGWGGLDSVVSFSRLRNAKGAPEDAIDSAEETVERPAKYE